MPESSCASLLKDSAITSKPSSPQTPSGGMRTEKSPLVIFSAARVICRTGRATRKRRRTSSTTAHSTLSSTTLPKVSWAARLICSLVNSTPSVACSWLTNSSIQQLMTNAMVKKKVTYRRSVSSQLCQRGLCALISAPPCSPGRGP